MVPPVASSSPASTLVNVVLPAPLRPTRPILSPRSTRKVTSSMSSRAPTRSSRSCTDSTEVVQFFGRYGTTEIEGVSQLVYFGTPFPAVTNKEPHVEPDSG